MKTLLLLLLLLPGLARASVASDAEWAAGRVLASEEVLSYYLTANDEGRITLLFGKFVGDAQIDAVLKRLKQEPLIKGITHSRVETDFCPLR